MRHRILIVADDDRHLASLRALLARHGYYVEAATDGLDAIQRARLGWFDLILMNADIPEVEGVAAARLIIDLTRDHGSPKIIALSSDPAALQRRLHTDAEVFCAVAARGCDPRALIEIMRVALAGRPAEPQAGATLSSHASGNGAPPAWPPARAARVRDDCQCAGRQRILLADDDELPREMLCTLLYGQGFVVEPAADGLQAVMMMGNTAYDAAVLDYDLPRMNGVAAARLAHDLFARADRPRLIALTAYPELVLKREREPRPVFDHVIPKSIGLKPVIDEIERCIRNA